MQELTPVVGNALDALRKRAREPREFNFMSGWHALPQQDLPSLDDLERHHRAYGPITRKQLMDMLIGLTRSRGTVMITETLLGVMFDVAAGTFLVTFDLSELRTVRGYVSGRVEPKHCSDTMTALITAFELHVMPAKAHAAELLNK